MSRMFFLSLRQYIWKHPRWLVGLLAIAVVLLGTGILVAVWYGDAASPPAELSKQADSNLVTALGGLRSAARGPVSRT
jgi:hypothetical protein